MTQTGSDGESEMGKRDALKLQLEPTPRSGANLPGL